MTDQEILIPACASSSPAFRMMYSVFKLNKQGGIFQIHIKHPITIQDTFSKEKL